MTTEKHDPWALLREARESVRFEARERANTDCDRRESQARFDFLSRIDDALAAHEAEERVTWSSNGKGLDATVGGYLVEVQPLHDGWWGWRAEHFPVHRDRQHGHKRTMEQAQEAAIAAARGMK